MQLQFPKKTVACLKQAVWEIQNQEQTQEVRLTDAMPDIGAVLGTWGQVILRSKEWSGGQITVSGGVMVWVLYAPEDGSPARSVESWVPFQMKWDAEDSGNGDSVRVSPLLRFADGRSTSARKLMLRVGISMLVQAVTGTTCEICTAEEVPEDVQLLRQNYPVTMAVEAGEKVFTLDDTLTLPTSCPPLEKLLRFTLRPELIDRKVMGDKVVFRGTAVLHILYCATDGTLNVWDFEVPFSQYAELNREYDEDAAADVMLTVTNLELDDRDGELLLQAGLTGQYLIYDRMPLEVVQDAYSPERKTNPQMQQLQLPLILEEKRESIHVEKSAEKLDGRIVDVELTMEHPKIHYGQDEAAMEFTGSFQILRYDEEGRLQGNTQRWEQQWSLPTGETCRVQPNTLPSGMPQISGNGMLRTDLLLELCTLTEQEIPMVEGLEIGEATLPDPMRPSLILRKTGDDCLWALAKSCGSTVEAIMTANHLTAEPDSERILLIPVT